MQNASASVSEEEYRRSYNDLTDRFRAVEEKHKQLTARRNRMEAESVSIGGMLTELEELEAPPIEFDEKLWHAVVDRVTVYNDDRLVYSLKDGSEITVRL
jgi:stress response protein YsnF